MAVGVLITEEHAHDRGNRERIEDPRLLAGGEPQARQVSKNQRQPGTPNEEFQDHHEEQPEADRGVHAGKEA